MSVYTEHSFWLIPAEPFRTQLRRVIQSLATTYDAVDFEPHVTLSCGVSDDQETIAIAKVIASRFLTQRLTATNLDYTNIYTKTLFVQFAASEQVQKISDLIKAQSSRPSGYKLNPHLSLLYKTIPESQQKELCVSVNVPECLYLFDRLRIIKTEIPLTQTAQIKRWRTVYECGLQPTP